MNQRANKTQIKSRGWLWKIPLGIVVLLLFVLVAAILSINTIAHNQINRALTTYLTEGGSLEAIDIGLMAGPIELNGFTINPPKGHGTDPLLSLGNLVLDVVPTSLLSDVIVVEEVSRKGMSLNLVRDKKGRMGLAELVKAEKPAAGKPDASSREEALPVVQVNKIRLEDGSLTVRDSALTGKPMVFPLTDIRLPVDQLRLFDNSKSGLGAGISIAEGGVDVAKEVGSGTVKVGKKLLGGLFDTGKGLVTLDEKQVKKGLVGSTMGTIDHSRDTLEGTGSAAGGGLGKSVSNLTGSAAVQAWNKGIPTRYQTAMQQAQQAQTKMPYPPVTK